MIIPSGYPCYSVYNNLFTFRKNAKWGYILKALAPRLFPVSQLVMNSSKYLGSLSDLKTKFWFAYCYQHWNMWQNPVNQRDKEPFSQLSGGRTTSSEQWGLYHFQVKLTIFMFYQLCVLGSQTESNRSQNDRQLQTKIKIHYKQKYNQGFLNKGIEYVKHFYQPTF